MIKTMQHKARRWKKGVLPATVCALFGFPADLWAAHAAFDACRKTSDQLFQACQYEARDDERVGFAVCLNMRDSATAKACLQTAHETRVQASGECQEVREARNQVCDKLGGGPYDPVINPAKFVPRVTNPYTPLQPGRFWVYEKQTPEGLERIRIDVLPETRVIAGVTMTVVHDVVTLDDVVIEDTIDWVAQDVNGDVWYFGEIVQNYEDGLLANLDGSFETGKNNAKPGFWMRGKPKRGMVYRQEFDLGNAEDIVEVVSLDAKDTTVPFSAHAKGPILKTRDTTPLSPGAVEFKYYVPGVGFALEVKPATGERLELVDYGPR